MFIPNQSDQAFREYRTIQSIETREHNTSKEQLQSNFWGMSLFTLLLTLALLSMLNLAQGNKHKD
jgi:hypothetical protein